VTPETRDFPRQLKRSLGLDLKVLSDIDYGVGVSYGVLSRIPTRPKRTIPGDRGPILNRPSSRCLHDYCKVPGWPESLAATLIAAWRKRILAANPELDIAVMENGCGLE
jgi:hypothetical protein